jgi:glucokinase
MKPRSILALGIDIGGSKIMTGIVDREGNIIGKTITIPTMANEPPPQILNRIYDAVEVVLMSAKLQRDHLSGIGLGVPGPLDIKNGRILDPWQLPTLQNFAIVKEFEKRYQIPVIMDNDANCFSLGESYFGAGKASRVIIGFTLGTGLGCGIVINRKIYQGAHELAGEVWISPYGDGIIEDKISGKGLESIHRARTGQNSAPRNIFESAGKNDCDALQSWVEFGKHLAYGIAWSVNLLDPDMVILGGSLSKGFNYFAPTMEEHLRKWINAIQAQEIAVVKAGLAEHGGMVGAACLVLSEEKDRINQARGLSVKEANL